MKTLLLVMPWVAFVWGAAMIGRALQLWEPRSPGRKNRCRLTLLLILAATFPSMAHAAATDLQTAVESGNAIIMYLSSIFAAVGIIVAGVSMMTGRHAIAKWAIVGAVVCGLAFAIVKTVWSNAGVQASDVSSFTP